MTLWLYIHFPSLQLDTLYHSGDRTPIVIVDGRNNSVVQINHTAHASGIRLGMGIGTATALCSHLQIHPYHHSIEQEKLSEIAHWLYMQTSDISLIQPKGLLLRVSNMLALYDGLDNYWQVLKAHLIHLNIHFQYATGYTPYAAKSLAKAGVNQVTDNAATIIERLNIQPLAMTELVAKTVDKLNRVGIKQVKSLLAISLTELAKRFDSELVNYVGQLSGQFKHPIVFYQPPEQFKRHIECLFDIENILWLERPLNLLLKPLEQFLFLRELVAHEVCLILHQRDKEAITITVCSADGEYRQAKWLMLLQLRLESVELQAPIISLTIEAKHQVAKQAIELDLFAGRQGFTSPAELVSTLQAKLGKPAVMSVKFTQDIRPEKANEYCQPLPSQKDMLSVSSKLRPSLLLPVPEPLKDHVAVIQGPERITTGWWDGYPIIRDYFIARSKAGSWLWIYRNQNQEWFLHGAFS